MRTAVVFLVAVFFAFIIVGTVNANLNDGLVAYYPFNGNASDESGNGNDGIVEGATLTGDRFGNSSSAYSFDGQDDFISIASSPVFRLTSWTITGWMKITDNSGPYSSNIIMKMNNPESHYNFGVSFWPQQWSYTDAIGVGYETCTDEFDHSLLFGDLPINEWVFFAHVRDETSGRYALYVDGSEVGYGFSDDPPCIDDQEVRVGYTDELNSSCFNGSIDDVRIYNRALSEAEIQQVYGIIPEPDPVEIDLGLGTFKIRTDKRTGETVLKLSGLPDLPELDLSHGDTVRATVTIRLFDVFEDGGDLVFSAEEPALGVKDTKKALVIRK